MSEMKTYIYFEDCGFKSEPFQAINDDAAIDHAMNTFRSPANPDFDGDSGGVDLIDDEDGERYGVCVFTGEDMIDDPHGAR
jgi:hypothetical protein